MNHSKELLPNYFVPCPTHHVHASPHTHFMFQFDADLQAWTLEVSLAQPDDAYDLATIVNHESIDHWARMVLGVMREYNDKGAFARFAWNAELDDWLYEIDNSLTYECEQSLRLVCDDFQDLLNKALLVD